MHIQLLLLASLLGGPREETLRAGTPGDVGMSAAVLEAGASLFADAVERDDLKGVVLLVARDGRIVLHEAYGHRDPERTQPMRTDSLFRMASNTKPVVAAAVLQLVEGGALGLDDPVATHLPSFDNPRAGAITIRQLLSHTGGLRIGPIFLQPLLEPSPQHPDAPTLQLEVERFGAIGAAAAPGTSYSYSNPGYNTLGALVEVASGQSLKHYLAEHIYAPLAMVDSCNHEPDADPERLSTIFRKGSPADDWSIGWQPGDPPDYPFVRASGGMLSSAHDYAVFCQALLQGGRYGDARILSAESVREATRPQTRHVYSAEELQTRRSFYGFGWSVHSGGVFSHGGSDGTYAWVDPGRRLIGLVFTQSPGGRNPREQFRRVVEAACSE